jgi:hypothetical protein
MERAIGAQAEIMAAAAKNVTAPIRNTLALSQR